MRYSTVTGGPNCFRKSHSTPRQVHYGLPPPNQGIHRPDYVQRGRRPINKDYAGRYKEHHRFVYA